MSESTGHREHAFILHPRLAADSVAVASLELSELRLMNDARFPWLILVPRRRGLEGFLQLDGAGQATLFAEIRRCGELLAAEHAPTRINIEREESEHLSRRSLEVSGTRDRNPTDGLALGDNDLNPTPVRIAQKHRAQRTRLGGSPQGGWRESLPECDARSQ